MKNVVNIGEVRKKIWQPPKEGEPEGIATLLDGQDLITPGGSGAIKNSGRITILVQNYRPGGVHKIHAHDDTEQVFFVYEGTGEFLLGEEWFEIQKGDLIFVPKDTVHAAKNSSDSTLILIFMSVPLGVEGS
jgi:quercetin dioxygenase-like cupin family protein